jgi:hypothetical protein
MQQQAQKDSIIPYSNNGMEKVKVPLRRKWSITNEIHILDSTCKHVKQHPHLSHPMYSSDPKGQVDNDSWQFGIGNARTRYETQEQYDTT